MKSFKIENKGVFFIAASQFGVAFSFHCILAFIPFYILKVSPFGPKETMIWTGMIMGAANVVASFTASFWGGLTSRFRPKFLFERAMVLNGILILLMGLTGNLYLLLLLRIMQGFLGGVSTIGLILISSLSSRERLHKDISLFQNSITAGQLLSPPAGAFAASLLGYRAPFILAFFVLAISTLFCYRYVGDIPIQRKESHPETPFNKGLLLGWTLCLIATIHVTFLPSILPTILEGFQLVGDAALRSAGFVIMLYTATALLGNHLLSRTASKLGLSKVIIGSQSDRHRFSAGLDSQPRPHQFLSAEDGPDGFRCWYHSISLFHVCPRGQRKKDWFPEFLAIRRSCPWTPDGNLCLGLFRSFDPLSPYCRSYPDCSVGIYDHH